MASDHQAWKRIEDRGRRGGSSPRSQQWVPSGLAAASARALSTALGVQSTRLVRVLPLVAAAAWVRASRSSSGVGWISRRLKWGMIGSVALYTFRLEVSVVLSPLSPWGRGAG